MFNINAELHDGCFDGNNSADELQRFTSLVSICCINLFLYFNYTLLTKLLNEIINANKFILYSCLYGFSALLLYLYIPIEHFNILKTSSYFILFMSLVKFIDRQKLKDFVVYSTLTLFNLIITNDSTSFQWLILSIFITFCLYNFLNKNKLKF